MELDENDVVQVSPWEAMSMIVDSLRDLLENLPPAPAESDQ